jgi:hypothetical protein
LSIQKIHEIILSKIQKVNEEKNWIKK